MKYIIDNNRINIPNNLIKEYENVAKENLTQNKIASYCLMAKKANVSNIEQYVIESIEGEIELIKMLPVVAKKISNGEISSDIE